MLIFFDFDSTIITQESLDEVIAWKLKDHPERESLITKIDQITNQGMNGSMPFTESAIKRMEVAQLHISDFETVGQNFTKHITEGMEELIAKLSKEHMVFVISGGFLPSLYPVTDRLKVPRSQVLANNIVTDSNGNVLKVDDQNPMWSNKGKGAGIKSLMDLNDIDPDSKTVLIGDGANDLNTWLNGHVDEFVGFGVNVVRESVKEQSKLFVESIGELEEVLERLE